MTERMSKWHRRGERQKETTDTYRDGWDRIFAKPAASDEPVQREEDHDETR